MTAATRAAIARGEALIYNGRLSADGLLAEPDLLRREGDGYAAIDIKSGAGEESAREDAEVKAANDLTVLPELARAKCDVLCVEFPTVHSLADANVARYVTGEKTGFAGIGPETLKRLQARAKLCVTPQAAPCFRQRVVLPTARQELCFDIETDPLKDLCYLHGFVARDGGEAATERFVAFFAEPEIPQAERDAFAAAWGFVREHADDGLLGHDAGEILRVPVAGSRSVGSRVHPVVRRVGEYSRSDHQAANTRI